MGEWRCLVVAQRRQRTVVSIIQTIGATVLVESDPLAAIDRFESTDVDCVVCEADLGPVSGLELLAALRERDGAVPCLLLGDESDDPFLQAALGEQSAFVSPPDDGEAIGECAMATDDQAASAEEVASLVDQVADQARTVSSEIQNIYAANEEQAQMVESLEAAVARLEGE